MTTDKILRGGGISLRQITLLDCSEKYMMWLNDPQVNRYLETRWFNQDLNSIKEFVTFQRNNDHSFLFAIDYDLLGCHVGNIKIGPIHTRYRHADVSYFIGEKNLWGKGIATEAIHLICRFGFEQLGLHRIEAGAYSIAIGSWKALEKNGFKREAVFREQVISDGQFEDVYRYGLLESEYQN